MKVLEKIREVVDGERRAVFSFEFFPQKTDEGMENLFELMDRMLVDTALDTGVSKGVSGYTAWHTGVCQGVFSLFGAAWSSSIEHGQ
ncbi:hypothetical protein KSP39_PZI014133 [Platanthera zijinensis]|uniref:Methylenetetrahydrofolate reductase n=1 Tax=Platanthera zijinensis TaxID=2320716 RepID=A0AAP0BC93_9ASPA